MAEEDELVNYDSENDAAAEDAGNAAETDAAAAAQVKKGSYVGIHASGFKDFMLKPELMRAVTDCGFEHPSEVQHECIPQANLGMDVICQAKSGMGKTAVFVLATLHQIEVGDDKKIKCVVVCHTRELASQIHKEYERFSQHMPDMNIRVVLGGTNIKIHKKMLEEDQPAIVVGTPGRMLALVKSKWIDLSAAKHFVIDECDKVLESTDMRQDVQQIFRATPHDKQVMMFSATLATPEIRAVCKKFCQEPFEVYVDDEAKLTLHGLQQYYIELEEGEKNRKLNDLLDALEFNQVIIFVSKVARAVELNKLLEECNFPSMVTHGRLQQADREARIKSFKNFEKRILVTTDLFGRGIDIERINIVINYDFPSEDDQYLHRVNRAGRFGTKGLAISFVSSPSDKEILKKVQSRFEVEVPELPDQIDISTYMNA